ncbi:MULTISPECIES: hypothetical protein [Bifidobacterium]|nr:MULTISPECIES: hypothetical protein [Bifidobacterium]QOL32264.1 hypothetical protein BE0216_07205 [Bifidobacterium eulemuris]QOL35224.1 hypothetical protein BL8807_05070 [Bifidobacterium lemurum]
MSNDPDWRPWIDDIINHPHSYEALRMWGLTAAAEGFDTAGGAPRPEDARPQGVRALIDRIIGTPTPVPPLPQDPTGENTAVPARTETVGDVFDEFDEPGDLTDFTATVKTGLSWRPIIAIGLIALFVAAAAFSGCVAWRHWDRSRTEAGLTRARATCAEANEGTQTAAEAYYDALAAAKTVANTDETTLKDVSTMTELNDAISQDMPEISACDAETEQGLDETTASLGEAAKWYEDHMKSLQAAADAVEESVLDKTIADAEALLAASDGKVSDNATREALAKAIEERDADAIASAVKSVNSSVKAKEEADRKAREEAEAAAAQAQAEAEAQVQSQVQQYYQQQSYTPSYSGGSGTGGSSGSNGGTSGTGGGNDGWEVPAPSEPDPFPDYIN